MSPGEVKGNLTPAQGHTTDYRWERVVSEGVKHQRGGDRKKGTPKEKKLKGATNIASEWGTNQKKKGIRKHIVN